MSHDAYGYGCCDDQVRPTAFPKPEPRKSGPAAPVAEVPADLVDKAIADAPRTTWVGELCGDLTWPCAA